MHDISGHRWSQLAYSMPVPRTVWLCLTIASDEDAGDASHQLACAVRSVGSLCSNVRAASPEYTPEYSELFYVIEPDDPTLASRHTQAQVLSGMSVVCTGQAGAHGRRGRCPALRQEPRPLPPHPAGQPVASPVDLLGTTANPSASAAGFVWIQWFSGGTTGLPQDARRTMARAHFCPIATALSACMHICRNSVCPITGRASTDGGKESLTARAVALIHNDISARSAC